MKKIVILSIFLFTYSFSGKAQNKKFSLDKIYGLTWHMNYVLLGEKKLDYTETQKKDNWMVFHKGGKHEVKVQGKLRNAKWEYDEKESMFTFKDNGNTTKQKIIRLTSTELVLEGNFKGEKMIFSLKKGK